MSATQEMPDILASYYKRAPDGVSYFDLPESTAQLVVVDDSDGTISTHFFELDDTNGWTELTELKAQAWGGSNGIRSKQHEGDKVTPVGQFQVLEAFYIDIEPKTGLDIFRITNDTYWVDDPDSVFYNKRIEGTDNKDWKSAEHMISYPNSYKYGFVIGYNPDCTPGLGSAVFFHVAERNTIGCVGVSEKTCLQYLAILDKDLSPYILIVSNKVAI
jgi:L,D-peptidoglycan transpeptidase YkuD (ErfK/YbiS/YcfS/YnhG family)